MAISFIFKVVLPAEREYFLLVFYEYNQLHTYILCLYHCSTPSADIFSTQLVSPEADSSLVMHHTRHTYPLVIERRAEQALHMIDEQMGV